MESQPQSGTIIIDWRFEPGDDPLLQYTWNVPLDPPGLEDEVVSKLLAEIAATF